MEFGFYLPCYYPDSTKPQADLFAEMLEQARFAEDVGFMSFTIPEHHFIDQFLIPSPLAFAVKVACETKHAAIVTSVLPLQNYNLLRLAGEITLTDHLTDGRFEIGLGRGAIGYEFRRFRAALEESREIFAEGVTLLEKLLTEYDVTFDGEFYTVEEPVTILPRCLQDPRPPVWIGAVSPESIEWSVRQGYHVQTTPLRAPWEVTRKQAQSFVVARDEDPERSHLRLHMLRQFYVSKNRKDIERMTDFLYHKHRKAANLIETPGRVTRGVVEPIDVELTPKEAAENVIFGYPDDVIETIQAHSDIGVDALQFDMSFGQSNTDVLAALNLFAEEVMPEVSSTRVGVEGGGARGEL